MFCPECGERNPEDKKFCFKCGSPLVETIGAPSESKTAENVSTQKREVQTLNIFTKKNIVILSIIVIAIVVVGSVFSVITKPEAIAKQYFNGIVNQDWGKVYDCIDVEKSDFVTKELFVQAMENSDEYLDMKNVENFEAKSFDEGLNLDFNKSSNDMVEEIIISYVTKGGQSNQWNVSLAKQKNNKFLLFDNYKVMNSNHIAMDCKITAFPFTKVYIDGIELGEKYLDIINDGENNLVTYTIAQIISGNHILKVSSDITNEYEQDITVSNGSNINAYNLEISDEWLKSKNTETEAFFKQWVSSALQGKAFSELDASFTSDKNSLETLKRYYEDLSEDSIIEDGTGLKSVDFVSFTPKSSNTRISQDATVCCSLKYKYNTTSVYKNYNDETEERTSTYEKSGTLNVYYTYENDSFVIKQINYSIYS